MELSTGIVAYSAQPAVITADGLGEIGQWPPGGSAILFVPDCLITAMNEQLVGTAFMARRPLGQTGAWFGVFRRRCGRWREGLRGGSSKWRSGVIARGDGTHGRQIAESTRRSSGGIRPGGLDDWLPASIMGRVGGLH